jgi:threonine dehydratase
VISKAGTFAEILQARESIAGVAIRTPLVRLNAPDAPADIWLKLENLQPIGSFKIRGAANAMARLGPLKLRLTLLRLSLRVSIRVI